LVLESGYAVGGNPAILKRPIERPIPYIYVDASYFKVRDSGKYVTKAFLIVTGVRDDGYREILGAMITDNESKGFWSGFFDELIDRGLKGVELVVSDGHKGIQSAVQSRFLGATWQMCQVHFSRAVLIIFQIKIRRRSQRNSDKDLKMKQRWQN
jgi:transposase-like protein